MILRQGRTAFLLVTVAAGLALGGCTKTPDQNGYVIDETLVAAIQPGVDNRDSVMATLGRPTFIGQFETNDWYYVSRTHRNLAFNKPQPKEQTVLRIRFDESGAVTAVERRGLEQVASIDPMSDKTPTLGRDRSLIEELFGNIGAVGSGAMPGGGTGPTP